MAKSYPILINNVYYNSACIAGRELGVDEQTILQRTRSKNFKEYSFTEFRPPLIKVCSTCKNEKPLDEFKKTKGVRDGHSSWCKKCWSIYVISNQNKENKKRNNHKWGQSEKGSATKKAAKEKRRAHHLDATVPLNKDERGYINWLYWKMKVMRRAGFDVHVDHRIPISKGGLHIPENLQIIPGEDNLRKTNKLIA
jgi:5-methylcytosine-specific restriction endonuclease McrA